MHVSWPIARRTLRKCRLEDLERLARFLGLEPPHMPREWHKDSLVDELEARTDPDGRARRRVWEW